MKNKNTIKVTLAIFGVAIGSILISEYSSSAGGNSAGAPAGVCGDPAGKVGGTVVTCNTPGCHTGAPVTIDTGWITSNIPVAGYTAGATYTITAMATRAGHIKFGFEVSPQNSSGSFLGTLVNTGTATQLTASNYITHTSIGTTGTSGHHTWTFNWTAPATGKGPVTFYGAFNVTNDDGNNTGDSIHTSTMIVSEHLPTGIEQLNNPSNYISVYPNPVSTNLTVKNSLNGTEFMTVTVFDSNGKMLRKIKDMISSESIDLSDLEQGYYIVSIATPNATIVKKIIKE